MRRLLLLAVLLLTRVASAATFTVDSAGDAFDVLPGDGLCVTLSGDCTLRAALDEANALPGADAITLPGGVYSTGSQLFITDDVTITGAGARTTLIDGGGAHRLFRNDSSTAAFTDLSILHGHELNASGGIQNGGSLTLTRCEVSSNFAGNAAGGIENTGTLTLVASTVADNSAGNACAGIDNTGTATLLNSTVSQNHAGNSGGGICNQSGGTLELSSCTVFQNTGGGGAGVETEDAGSTTTLRNTVVDGAPISVYNDGVGTTIARGRNAVRSTFGLLNGPGSVLTGPSGLGALGYNGGETRTVNFRDPFNLDATNSFALDGADPAVPGSGGDACPTTDQRGAVRPQGTACDIGALEGGDPICGVVPRTDCKQPVAPKGSRITLRSDRFTWTWKKGKATSIIDYDYPELSDSSYRLCIYDRPGGIPRLVRSPLVPASGFCDVYPKVCWKLLNPNTKGFKYHDRFLTPNGVSDVVLKPGIDGKAAITVKGKGPLLGTPPPLPLTPQVTVQLVNTIGRCWDAEFVTFVKQNTSVLFSAQSGSPSGAFVDPTR